MNNLQLITTKQFNDIAFDCYQESNNTEDFWATRDQIGRLLGYSDPRIAIAKIHDRNKDRLDQFSGVTKLTTPLGGSQNVTVYNFKGLLEICRFSRQPNADAVMDFVWDVMDELRKKGNVSIRKQTYTPADEMALLECAARMLNMNDASKILMMSKFCEERGVAHGFLPKYEDNGGRQLIAATTLLKEFGLDMSAMKFNQAMVKAGYLEERERPSSKGNVKRFKALTEKGRKYGENQISPQNPREVQPLYYEDSFKELYRIITRNESEA